jgi:PTH1 family peptidyl-tRNA hydrolase
MKVVVGLGNPGRQYAGTRHNVGFDVIDYLAKGPGVGSSRSAFQSEVVEMTEGGEKVLLVKPQTFMNLSGRAVRAVLDFYKLTPADLLVVCDDYNLPLGKLRVRAKGSAGGQNGLKNIQDQLGTDEYPRLRVGIGQPAPGEAVDFVLTRFKPGERAAADEAVANAANGVLVWVRQGLAACMNRVNGPSEQGSGGGGQGSEKKAKKAENRSQKSDGGGQKAEDKGDDRPSV